MAETSNRQKEIFLKALDIPSSVERAAYVTQVCGGDEVLRGQIDAMLQAHGAADSFLEKPAAVLGLTVDASDAMPMANILPNENIGTRIGPYKLLEQIGEGGMGIVFMAEQQAPVRRMVALKIIKPGMDSGQVLARFEAERQALALMDHPNIAKVLDAGATADGRPFFVMELVKGMPITAFCDANKLSARLRLELFVPVCQAIQHAHQKGVIHRDIKPSNVLIALYDDKPVAKVIDFGVAKATGLALTERTLNTGFGAIIGTPEYMSPEQATFNQLDIDTRSDVYSLGVLLYELLTGTTPVDKAWLKEAAILEVLRLVREEEPPRPSVKLSTTAARASIAATRGTEADKLVQLLRGELDWIVMKALEKDRNRRYESAASFGRDVERYLIDEPVEASPPTMVYRLRKLVKRNRGVVAAIALVLLALLGGMAGTTWGLIVAQQQRDRAEVSEANALAAEGRAIRGLAKAEQAAKDEKVARNLAQENEKAAKIQAKRAESAHYAILTDHAFRTWKSDQVVAAGRILDRVDEPFRKTWEYRYLRHLCHRKAVWLAPKGTIDCIAFSTDGRSLAAGDKMGTVTIWETATGKVQKVWNMQGEIMCLAFSGNNEHLAVGTHNKGEKKRGLRFFNTATGTEELTIPIKSSIRSVAFRPDGQQIVVVSDDAMRVFDARTGRERIIMEKGPKTAYFNAVYSPDGKWIAGGGRDPNLVKIWDATTLETYFEASTKGTAGTSQGYLQFNPDSKFLLVASGQWIEQWDIAKKQKTLIPKQNSGTPSWDVTYDPQGEHIVYVYMGRVVSYRSQNASWPQDFLPHVQSVTHLAMSREGKLALDDTVDGLQIWSFPRTPEAELTLDVLSTNCAAFHPDSKSLVTLSAKGLIGKLVTWDASTGEKKRSFDLPSQTGEFSLDGSLLVSWHVDQNYLPKGNMKVWETATGKESHALPVDATADWGLAFSSDNRRLASAGIDGAVRIWDLKTGELLRRFTGHTADPAVCAAFSPDGAWIVSGNRKEMMKIWDSHTGRELLTLPAKAGGAGCAKFSPDAQDLVIHDGEFARVLNASTGDEKRRIAYRHGTQVTYSPDGSRLFLCDSLFDAATGQQLLPTTFQFDGRRMIFSPDGKRIFSSGWGARIWTTP